MKRGIKMRILPAALVAAIALLVLFSPPQARAAASPAKSASSSLTPAQGKAAHDRMMARIKAARAAHGKDKPLTPAQSKAAHDRMLARIKAARAAAAPATP
jgi:hypothetical protein